MLNFFTLWLLIVMYLHRKQNMVCDRLLTPQFASCTNPFKFMLQTSQIYNHKLPWPCDITHVSAHLHTAQALAA